jgi:hypothetical protein
MDIGMKELEERLKHAENAIGAARQDFGDLVHMNRELQRTLKETALRVTNRSKEIADDLNAIAQQVYIG